MNEEELAFIVQKVQDYIEQNIRKPMIPTEMDGSAYNKCRCGAFMFENIANEDVPSFKKLLNEELLSINA